MGLDVDATRQLLDAMFAASPDLLALTDPDGTVVRVNPAWHRLLGWTEEEVRGRPLSALRHADDDTGEPILGGRFRWRCRDGGYRWVQWHGAVLEEQQLVLVAGRDVTDTVVAEEAAALESERLRDALGEREELLDRANAAVQALEQERGAVLAAMHQLELSERQFTEVFDHSPVAKIVVGLRGPDRGRILLANPAFHELLGHPRDQLAELRIWDLSARPDEELEQNLRTLASGEQTRGVRESVLIRADGSHVDALSRTSAIFDDDGPVTAVVQLLDMTAERRARAALAESEQRFRAQFVNSAVGQLVCSLDGRIIDANPAYAAMIGHPVEALTGMLDRDFMEPADVTGNRHRIAALFAGEADSYLHEGRARHADGHRVDVEATVSLVRDSADRPKHLIAVISDISARRAAEQARDAAAAALTDRNHELEAANQLKLDIIGMLGHEIGNPLTTIQGNAEILADDWAGLADGHRVRVIEAIVRQAGRLDEIVREVLALVTLDAGMTDAERHALPVRAEITQALAAAGHEAVPVHGPDARVLFQPGHFQQILINLLSNAAKYGGGATGIHIIATGARVEVVVEDNGPGVPEEFRSRLFERLARADRDADAVKGTGLGLYIVHGLAEANQATIHYEPNPAGGSRFVLSVDPA